MAQESCWRSEESFKEGKISFLLGGICRGNLLSSYCLCRKFDRFGCCWINSLSVKTRIFFWSFLKKEKTEGKPPVHDQPERQSIIWIDIFTLTTQDEDINPINSIRVGLAHPSLMGSIPRWNRMNTSSTISNLV